MNVTLWDRYVGTFKRVLESMPLPREALVEAPGILGRPGVPDRPNGRFLITDDRAGERLDALGDLHASMVLVLPEAPGCCQRLEGHYGRQDATAMVLGDLAGLEVALDPTLSIRRAALAPADGEVPLVSAAAANLRADPVDDLTPEAFAAYLDSIPNASLLAAVDADGVVRATAGSAVFDEDARVFFVSTDPAMRGQGVGTAMTAAALRAAAASGARRACLEGSASGESIYRRLGFESVRPIVIFSALG